MDGKRAQDASQNASGTPIQSGKETPYKTRNTPETGQQLIDCLTKAQGVLLKYKNKIPGPAQDGMATILNKAIALARAL